MLGVRIMATAIVTEEGYIDLPRDIRDKLHLHAGDTLDIEIEKGRVIRMHPKTLKPSDVSGFLASKTHVRLSIEEMDEAVAEAFRKGDL
jgi:AbrB family looped-hinge helix DNA binding protein